MTLPDTLLSHSVLFMTGIDTDAGKTYATAFLARAMMDAGLTVATQKFIQTGSPDGSSEDIEAHRRLCGMAPLPEDIDRTTAPLVYTHPCSAQLAARLDGRDIDLTLADRSTRILSGRYDRVIVEGAGGLMVPITDTFLTIDYITTRHLPLVLTTNGRLGSINHTLLSLEAIAGRHITLAAVLYNRHFDTDPHIAADTLAFITRRLATHHPATPLIPFD